MNDILEGVPLPEVKLDVTVKIAGTPCCERLSVRPPVTVPRFIGEPENPDNAAENCVRFPSATHICHTELATRYVYFQSPELTDAEFLKRVSIGAAITFRQEWCVEGYSRGELIKTVPLAPGETTQVSVETQRGATSDQTFIQVLKEGRETTAESVRRDSSEVVERVARQSSYDSSTSAGLDVAGMVKAITFGFSLGSDSSESGSLEEITNKTSSSFGELTRKVADQMRRERTQTVSTTSSESEERLQKREITNSNGCHSLHLNYYQVNTHYRVLSQPVEIRPVVFVPSPGWKEPSLGNKDERMFFGKPGSQQYLNDLRWVSGNEGTLRSVLLDPTLYESLPAVKRALLAFTSPAYQISQRIIQATRTIIEDPWVTSPSSRIFPDEWHTYEKEGLLPDWGPSGSGVDRWIAPDTAYLRHVMGVRVPGIFPIVDRFKSFIDSGVQPLDAIRSFVREFREFFHGAEGFKAHMRKSLSRKGISDGKAIVWNYPTEESYPDAIIPFPTVNLSKLFLDHVETAASMIGETVLSPGDADAASLDNGIELPTVDPMDEVAVERLLHHLRTHRMHYLQAVWMSEDQSTRLVRFSQTGLSPDGTMTEDLFTGTEAETLREIALPEILAFYGNLAIHPLNGEQSGDHTESIENLRKRLEKLRKEDFRLVLPAEAVILEPVVGSCDSCEEHLSSLRSAELKSALANGDIRASVAQALAGADTTELTALEGVIGALYGSRLMEDS